jgi:SNF2 family DNA or RNA helicase
VFKGTLHPYQQEAHDLIVDRFQALVGFEVGLGKTPVTISAVEALMDRGFVQEPGLIITLASLKYQWAKSIETFSDSKPLVIDGSKAQRLAQYEQARDWESTGVDYIILNYETVVSDFAEVSALPRGFAVFDESTALKSTRSRRHKMVKKLTKDVTIRVGLTGTPMTNGKPEEIYNQLLCIDPSVLGSYPSFMARYVVQNQFGWITNYRNLKELHNSLQEVMISKRQTDPDVAPYLPETIYRDPIHVPLDRAGKAVYRRIKKDLLEELEEAARLLGDAFDLGAAYRSDQGGPADELRGGIASKVTALRMLCSHPELLRHSAQQFKALSGSGSKYLYELAEEGVLDKLGKAPKVESLARYVSDFLDADPNNKVVIFSVFVPTLAHIQTALKYGSVLYSGAMNAKEKEQARVKFQTDPKTRVLISSDAGGFGVDLPQANLLVNFDLPWASGTAIQRNGRIQRASSTWKHVVIQNFLIEDSLEIRQWEQLQQKSRIEAAVIDGKGINKRGGVRMDVASLRAFLKASSL